MAETDITGRIGQLEIRQSRSEAEIEDLRRQVERLETDVAEMRREQAEMRNEMAAGFREVKDALANVVTSALNSMPQWAASSLRNQSVLVGALGGLLAASVTIIFWLAARHG